MAGDPFAGGSSSSRSSKSKPPNPRKQFIQAASKIARTKGPAREKALEFLGYAVQDIPSDKLYRLGEKADLPPGDIDKIRMAQAQGKPVGAEGFVTLMDILDRPAQAVKGAITEPDNPLDVKGYLEGAYKGVAGKEKYGGTETALSLFQMNAKSDEAIKKEVESIPGPVRFATDLAVDIAIDPTNYVTLGGGAIAETAAKSIAKNVAESAAQRGLTMSAQQIFEKIMKEGTKALDPAYVKVLKDELGEKTAKRLLRRANKAQGGIYFMGKKIPLSQKPQQAMRGGVLPEGWGSGAEAWLRTEPATRRAVRAGDLPEGTTGTVQSINEGRRAANTGADIGAKEVERRAAVAVGRIERGIPDGTRPVSIQGSQGVVHSVKVVKGDPYAGIPEGHIRFFRGEDPTKPLMTDVGRETPFGRMSDTPAPGKSWSLSPKAARGYVGEKGSVYYVDVPVRDAPGGLGDRAVEIRQAQNAGDDAALTQQFYPAEFDATRGPLVDITSLSDRAQRRIIKAGERALKKSSKALEKGTVEELDLNAVREALDVNGGPAAIAALPPKEQALAAELRKILDEDFAGKVESGRLMDDLTAPGVKGESAAAEFDARLAKAREVVARLERKRYKQSGKYANALGRVKQLEREAAQRGDDVAGARAVAREAALERQAVAGEVKGLNRTLIEQARDARRALDDAAKTVKNMERELGQPQSLVTEEDLARAVGDLEDAKAAYAKAERLRTQVRDVDAPAVPRSIRPTPVRKTGPEVAAQGVLSREQALLRVAEKQKRRAMNRAMQIARRQREAAEKAAAAHVPQDRYFPHLATDDAKKAGFGRGRRDVPASQLTSSAPGYTRRRKWKGAASEAELPDGTVPYELNPVVAIGRNRRITRADAGRIEMFDEIRRMPAVDDNPIVHMGDDVKAYQEANPRWEETYDELKQPVSRDVGGRIRTVEEPVLVHKSVAEDFRKVIEAKPDILEKVRWLNSMWARWATATTGFISRNVLQGNLYMGVVLAEARDMKVWADTMRFFKRMNRGLARYGNPEAFLETMTGEIIPGMSYKTAMQELFDNGVVSSGFYDDLAAATARVGERRGAVLGGKWSPLSPNFKPIERVSAANQWAENWSRAAVYLNKRKQGFTPAEAALVTDHYMLNYRNLSKVNDAGRIVSPFLTWVYKSTPMILGEVARTPRKALIPLRVMDAVSEEGKRDLGNPLFPGWIERGGGVVLPDEAGPFAGQVWMPDTPLHSTVRALRAPMLLGQLLANQGENWTNQALGTDMNVVPDPGPNVTGDLAEGVWDAAGVGGVPGGIAKSVVEGMTNQQLFTGREYTPGEQVPMPGYTQLTGDKVPFQVRLLMENLFPVAGRAAAFAPTSEYEKRAQQRRLLSMLSGFSMYKADKGMEDSAYREWVKDMEAFVKKMRSDQTGDVPRRVNKTSGGSLPAGSGGRSSGSGRSTGRGGAGNPFG